MSMYIRWLTFYCDSWCLEPPVYFLSMWTSGIIAITNSNDSVSLWKMPLCIINSAKFFLPADSYTHWFFIVSSMNFKISSDIIITGWNDKIVALEKTTWLHFRLMKTGFRFLLQTIYKLVSCVKIPRAIEAYYHVWKWHNVQRARSEVRRCITQALYQSKLWQLDHCQHTQNTIPGSSTCPGWWKQSFRLRLWSLMWFQVKATSHLRSRFESQHQSVPGCAEECGDALVQSSGRWQTLCVAAGLGAGPQVQRDPGLASEGVLRLCTILSLTPLLRQPEPAGLLRLVIHREHHQHDLPQHQSQPDHRHPPSIHRAPTNACGKGMLPVPDPYRGGDWGWRWLHWIDVSSTT